MQKEGWDQWGKSMPGFDAFWTFLNQLAAPKTDQSCRNNNCGAPFCTIRKCVQEKDFDVCPFCGDYPCHRIEGLAKGYVNLIPDGRRMNDIGLDKWIEEQQVRKDTGFCYADIRCYPYDVPDK